MRIILSFILLILIPFQAAGAGGSEFKLVKTIGDDRENYTLYGLGDAVISDNKVIYILNVRGNYVSCYDWNGAFIRTIGQKGQGPGDFHFPRSLAYHNNKLFVLDRGNHRIAEINLQTYKFKYYKETVDNRFSSMFAALDGNRFLGVFNSISSQRGRIGIVGKDATVIHSFFNAYPIKMDTGSDSMQIRDGMPVDKILKVTVYNNSFEPVCDYDKNTNEILVTFRSPDNPVKFFVYNTGGKLLKEFSYTITDSKYKFNRFFLNAPFSKIRDVKKWPPRFEPNLRVYILRDHYIAFLALHDFKGKEIVNRKVSCLVFSRQGKLIQEIPMDDKLLVSRESNGYILAGMWEEEVEKLYIYQLDVKK